MKKIALLLCCFAFVNCALAQMPDGSYAPDFSIYEIDKDNGQILTDHAYTLTEYTDLGQTVYIDFFAIWCHPCWTFHQSGAFESLYNQYGPNGTGEVMVFGIEAGNGNYASLCGTGTDNHGSTSYGNWLNGVPYPIIPLDMSPNNHDIKYDYQVSYYPTIYMVCPNRTVYEVGQVSLASLIAAKEQHCPTPVLANNARIVQLSGVNDVYYCNANFTPVVKIKNIGTSAITSLELKINLDGQDSTFNWTGNIGSQQNADITLPQINETENGDHTYKVTIVKVNGANDTDPTNNSKSSDFSINAEGTSELDERFTTDNYTETWICKNDLVEWKQAQQAITFDCFNINQGQADTLYLPLVDLSVHDNPLLHFDVAHASNPNGRPDQLEVFISSNCGDSWRSIYDKTAPELSTATVATNHFVPTEDSQWRSESIDLTNYRSSQVLIKFVFTSGHGKAIWIDNVQLIPDCPAPEDLAGTASSLNSITLGWEEIGDASTWEIKYGVPGFDVETEGTTVTANSNPFTVPNLSASTMYEFYIRALCSDEDISYWSFPATYSTECGVITDFPFTETFEYNGEMAPCWTQEYVAGNLNWICKTGNHDSGQLDEAHSGSFNVYFQANSYNLKTKLISPVLDLTQISNPYVYFWHTQAMWVNEHDDLKVFYRTSNTASWNELIHYGSTIRQWTFDSLALPNPSATYQIAFEGLSGFGYGVTLDDITIASASDHIVSTCDAPTELNASTTNTTATVNWTETGTFEMAYKTAATTNWSTPTTINGNTHTFTDLEPNTEYNWRVRQICDDGNSIWVTSSFTTTSTGIENHSLANSIVLYPNPSSNYIDVKFNNDIEINEILVYDVYGKLLQRIAVTENPIRISIAELSNGVYFVKAITKQGIVNKSFIKQ